MTIANDGLLFLGESGQRQVRQSQRIQRAPRRAHLREAAVDEDQVGARRCELDMRFCAGLGASPRYGIRQPPIASLHHFGHHGGIVGAFHGADAETAVVPAVGKALHGADHAGYSQ